eukprot:Gb_02443 [translate_table: standard]
MADITERRPLIAVIGMVVLIVSVGSGIVEAQTPPTSTGCTNAFVSLNPCLGYITGTSNVSNPACCTALAAAANNAASCLCQFFGTSNPLGFPINQTQALTLPGLCNVNTPPLIQCTGSGSGSGAPVAPPPAAGVPVTPPVASPGSSPAPATPVAPTGISPPAPSTTDTQTPVGVPTVPSVGSPSVPQTESGPTESTPDNNNNNDNSSNGGSTTPSSTGTNTNSGSGAGTVFTPSIITLVVGLTLASILM